MPPLKLHTEPPAGSHSASAPHRTPIRSVAVVLGTAFLFAATAGAADTDTLIAFRVEELRRSAVVLRTIDPADHDFADLEPLREVLRGRRVVVLGEATHGEGSTFLAKTRLIEFLHRELGFDVLAWETGMHDARLAWRALRSGEVPIAALRLGLIPIWSESEQLSALGEALARAAAGPAPLELVGLDTHVAAVMRGEEARAALLAELARIDGALGEAAFGAEALATLDVLAAPAARTADRVARALAVLEGIRAALARPAFAEALGVEEVAWWRQELDTLAHKVRAVDGVDASWEPGAPMAPVFNPRDAQLGANLVWLARERFPRRKIVVWCATMHSLRQPEILDASAHGFDYAGVAPMGRYASLALGDDLYVLGFTAGGGETALPWLPTAEIEPAPEGSFEAIADGAGLEHAWIDFSGAPPGSWLRGSFVARPLGHLPMSGVWSSTLDGLFFERRATRSDRRVEPDATDEGE